jgi:hypothetical protein
MGGGDRVREKNPGGVGVAPWAGFMTQETEITVQYNMCICIQLMCTCSFFFPNKLGGRLLQPPRLWRLEMLRWPPLPVTSPAALLGRDAVAFARGAETAMCLLLDMKAPAMPRLLSPVMSVKNLLCQSH